MVKIFCDASWSGEHGIGRVYKEYIGRPAANIELDFFDIKAKKRNLLYPLAFSSAARQQKADVIWSVGFFPPALRDTPTVITVHDLTHLHFYTKVHRAYYDIVMKPLYRRVDKIITVSEFTRRELIAWSGCDPARVVTVLNGVGPEFNPEGEKIDKGWPYLFYPGNRRSYKNIRRMVKAYARSSAPARGVRLLLTGKQDDTVAAWAAENNVSDMVMFTGYLSDADIPRYYRSALGIVYISLYEGFGLPILEAMASGRPVITSTVSSMPEVAGTHALLVDPYVIEQVASAMDRIVEGKEDSTEQCAARITWARRFSWADSAEKLWSEVSALSRR